MAPLHRSRLNLPVAPGERSCATCPSAATHGELAAAAGKGINGPTCRIKMIPLLRPNADEKVQVATTKAIAKSCSEYGKPALPLDDDARIRPLEYSVGLPSPNETAPPGKVTSCHGCTNLVRANEVMSKTGWNAALCLAKGTLLLTDRYGTYANGCEYSRPATMNSEPANIEKFIFLPEYTESFGKVDVLKLAKRQHDTLPEDWPTDRPVTAKQAAKGIKSWRQIVDPEGYGSPVFLPIFNINAIPEHRRVSIPRTGDDEAPEDYIDHAGAVYRVAVFWRGLDETPMVWGLPGVGKTELFRHLAWMMALPFDRFSITESTELDDLAGKMHFRDNQTEFEYGRLPKSWQEAGVVCLDEPNVGPPAVWQFIRPLTDNSKQLVLDMNNGERIRRHEFAFLGMAANPAWDIRNVGAATIGDADARRLMHINMPLPPESVERQIVKTACSKVGYDPTPNLDNLFAISKEIREMAEDSLPISWGVANNIKVAKAMKYFSPLQAYAVAVLDYLSPEAAEPVRTAIKTYYPV